LAQRRPWVRTAMRAEVTRDPCRSRAGRRATARLLEPGVTSARTHVADSRRAARAPQRGQCGSLRPERGLPACGGGARQECLAAYTASAAPPTSRLPRGYWFGLGLGVELGVVFDPFSGSTVVAASYFTTTGDSIVTGTTRRRSSSL
jgi:hypothetical protein